MSDTEIATRKAALRAQARALRSLLPERRRSEQSVLIAERVLGMPEIEAARAVLAYGSNDEEVDPQPIVDALRARGVRIAYPRMVSIDCLGIHWVTAEDDQLAERRNGIREPIADRCECASPEEIDVILVPGIAFGRDGYRIGFGAGYFDRFLPSAPQAFKIGLAFDEQLFDEVPHDIEFDVPVDALVTPSAIIR